MGENADQTRDEIVQLRQEMSQKIAGLRKAAERPVRIAKMAAVGTVAVVVVGTAALIVLRARRRAEARTFKGRAKTVVKAVQQPEKTARKAREAAEKTTEEARQRLRDELRQQVQEQVKDIRPLREKILTGAVQSAASAAVPIVMKKLQERMETAGTGARKP